MTTLKPTQRPCKTCMYFDDKLKLAYCLNLDTPINPWWKGCIRHVEKEGEK